MRSFLVALIVAGLGVIAEAQGTTDWTQWRGLSRDGVIASFTSPQTWPDAIRSFKVAKCNLKERSGCSSSARNLFEVI